MRGGLLVSLVALLFSASSLYADTRTLTLGCISSPGYPDYDFVVPVLKEAFHELGYKINVVSSPSAQTIDKLRRGELDGDCARIYNYADSTGLDLIKVDPPLRQAYLSSWSLSPKTIDAYHFRDTLTAAYDSNAIAFTYWVKKMGYKNVLEVTGSAEGFEALKKGKADIFFGHESAIRFHFKGWPEEQFHYHGPIMTVPVHLFLHLRHKSLAADLKETLRRSLAQRTFIPPFKDEPQSNKNKPKIIKLVCSAPTNSKEYALIVQYYQTVFAKLGYQVNITYQPPTRGIASLRNKDFDGSCGRHSKFANQMHMDLIKVEAPIAMLSVEAWTTDPSLRIHTTKELQPFSIAHVRGLVAINSNFETNKILRTTKVLNTTIGLKMLAAERIDVFVGIKYFIVNTLVDISARQPLFSAGKLYQFTVNPYLQPELKHLAKPLAEIMRQEGYAFDGT